MELRVADDIIRMSGTVHRICRDLAHQDADLAKQARRAVSSLGLNFAEGHKAKGGNRTSRMESAREAIFALKIAGAAGYLDPDLVAREADSLDRIVAILWKLTYRRRT